MKRSTLILSLVLLSSLVSSCEVVGGIFKAGMVWGIFLVAVLIGLVIYLVTKTRK